MPHCIECGKKVDEDDDFCPECGTKTKHKKKEEKEKNTREEPMKEKIVVKESHKKNSGIGVLVFFLILIGGGIVAFIYFSEQHSTGGLTDIVKEIRSPKLSVSNIDGDLGFSLSQGCYGTIRGIVYNIGNANAEGVRVECNVKRRGGGLLTSASTSAGSVYSNSQQSFSMNIDFSCMSLVSESDTDFNCRADCNYC